MSDIGVDMGEIGKCFAGYYKDEYILNSTTSGGIATEISNGFIKNGGVVYGVSFSDDYKRVIYRIAEKTEELLAFKGSKYTMPELKMTEKEETISVFDSVKNNLLYEKKVLFFGVGCIVSALKRYLEMNYVDDVNLYCIELLCDGCTYSLVQREYVAILEEKFKSKIRSFCLRDKSFGWGNYFICAEFVNDKRQFIPFDMSEYGYAFGNYKVKKCYTCAYKGEKNHVGDLVIGDFWGCRTWMKEYNKNGVSVALSNSFKAKKLIDMIDVINFNIMEISYDSAVRGQPRFFLPHPMNPYWEELDEAIKEKGLKDAISYISLRSMPKRFDNKKYENLVVWGQGDCLKKYGNEINRIKKIDKCVDVNEDKWGKEVFPGILCENPDSIRILKAPFVIITVLDKMASVKIANTLLDMGIDDFDFFENWNKYKEHIKFT